MSDDIAKTIPLAWEQRDVRIVLPLATARAIWRRAAQWDVEEGGRFDARPYCILLWSASCVGDHDHPEPRGEIYVSWGAPTLRQATIRKIGWDPSAGGSEAEVWRALGLLVGKQRG